jgi:phage terminase large subunit-like protein
MELLMADETEEGPDANDIRRHAKRMLTEMQYRQKYRRLDYYKPNHRQLEFHNTIMPERMLRAGSQQGKTHAGAAQMAFDLCALYPEWYKGRRFLTPPKIERPYDFVGWGGSTTQDKTREGIQSKLFGDIFVDGGLGSGLVPLDNIIGRPVMARGISGFIDTAILRREGGGKAAFRQKTYAMGREGWQVESVDEVWMDEDSSKQDNTIYSEVVARTTATRGQIIVTMTPVPGLTELRKRFKSHHPGTTEIVMGLDDCLVSAGGHIADEDVPAIVAKYQQWERATRLYGADMQGEGCVFETPIDQIKHNLDPASVPPFWPWLWSLDFRHSGSATTGHPFAAVLGTHDRETDTIYVMHAIRMMGMAIDHAARIKDHVMWDAPISWPHDGGRGASLIAGDTIAQTYKKLGLNMRPQHAEFSTGGFNFEAGIDAMANRFRAQKLLIAGHLHQVFDEYQGYHRVDGVVNKIDDDLLSAIRVLCMDIRNARTSEQFLRARRVGHSSIAKNVDFDLFTGRAFDAA